MPTKARVHVESQELIGTGAGCICDDGYEWVEGRTGARGSRAMFLVSKSKIGTVRPPPEDLSVKFADLEATPGGILSFARRHGQLGLPVHFHVARTVRFGETWADWCDELNRFRSCFRLWEMAEARDQMGIRGLLTTSERLGYAAVQAEPAIRKDPLLLARYTIVCETNFMLAPGTRSTYPKTCFIKGCPHQARTRVTPHTTFSLQWSIDRDGKGKIQPLVSPSPGCLSAIWLQFAHLISGERRLRRCEAADCRKWMDVTESNRPGARRMHPECSRRWRQRRWRESS